MGNLPNQEQAYILKFLSSLILFLIEFHGDLLITWIFKIRSEQLKMSLLQLIIVLLDLLELAVLSAHLLANHDCELLIEVGEDSRRDSLALLRDYPESTFPELSHTTDSEVFTLASHSL
jgi:hypothetical protein